MNNFTRDELLLILESLDELRFSKFYKPETLLLRGQIIFLLDNYCDHENDIKFNAVPVPGIPKMCTKCKEFYL